MEDVLDLRIACDICEQDVPCTIEWGSLCVCLGCFDAMEEEWEAGKVA